MSSKIMDDDDEDIRLDRVDSMLITSKDGFEQQNFLMDMIEEDDHEMVSSSKDIMLLAERDSNMIK